MTNVTTFQVGQEVYGIMEHSRSGSYNEYAIANL